MITTHKGFQVIRVAQIKSESRKGEAVKYYCYEVVQRWISANGKVTDMALLRGFNFCYCDVLEKAREFDPFGHAGFDPSGITRLTP